MTTRLVLVDDQELVRTGFRMILESEDDLTVVGEAADGREAISVVGRTRPDIVLMDIRMPVLDGVEATRQVVGNRPAKPPDEPRPAPVPKVIILTTFDLDEYVFAALQAGASGFLLKDTPADELIAAIRVVAQGEALLAPSVTRRLIEEFRSAAPTPVEPHPGVAELTERERDVLLEMAKGRSNSEIGEALYVSETTIKTHVGRVLAKLDVRDRVQAVVIAYESGVVQPGIE